MKFDESTDVLVVGSGGGALTAAVTASVLGAKVLVVEKSPLYGGTSATSGGAIWIPNSHHTRASSFADSREKALRYLLESVGSEVDRARIEAYVDNAPKMLEFLERHSHVRYVASPYSDYYPELPGGSPEGFRTHEPLPMSARRLGKDFDTLRPPHHAIVVMGRYGLTNDEAKLLLTQSPGWRLAMLKIMARYWLDVPARLRGRRDTRLTHGNALIGRLKWTLNDRNVPLWLSAPLRELIVDGRHVRGAVVERGGRAIRIEARAGVILGTGGFEHNAEMRERFLPKPTSPEWSASQEANSGDGIRAGQQIGAAVALMDEAWWCPVIPVPGVERPWALFAERSLPGQVIVDRRGLRFTNEAAPYLEMARSMYERHSEDRPSVPAYVIFDAEFRNKYPYGPLGPGSHFPDSRLPASWEGTVYFKASSLAELARRVGIDPAGLEETVRRNNEYARDGRDPEFHRGDSQYDRHYADPSVKPNPCIGPIGTPPFYAIPIYPGDIGTKGGLVTDEHARVLNTAGVPFTGLYAIGNTAASVMGRKYPGAGATIGPSMTFGFVAASHALGAPV